MLSIKNSTLLIISHIGHIICGEITTRIFLGASGFWHSSSFWFRVFFFFLFPLPLNLQSSQLIDGGVFPLSVPTTFPLYAFVSGSSFDGLLLGAGLPMCVHFVCVCTWIFLKMLETTVNKCRRVRPILYNKPKAPRRLHLLWVKRFIQRFS